jgi:CBS domain-containing protein
VYEFLEYRVCDVMTEDPVTIGPGAPLRDAARVFDEHDFNALPVVSRDGELLGVVTKLDLLSAFRFTEDRLFPPYDEILARPVSDVMTVEPLAVTPRALLTDVLEKLVSSRHKSLPVMDGDRLVGMVAREDVLDGLRRAAAGEVATGPI